MKTNKQKIRTQEFYLPVVKEVPEGYVSIESIARSPWEYNALMEGIRLGQISAVYRQPVTERNVGQPRQNAKRKRLKRKDTLPTAVAAVRI